MSVRDRLTSWFTNICLLGLIPVVARLFVWELSKQGVEPFAVSDLVAFGLVVHSANINEISRSNFEEVWSNIHLVISILFIVLYALLLFTTILSIKDLRDTAILDSTGVLAIVSFVSGLVVFWGSSIQSDEGSSE